MVGSINPTFYTSKVMNDHELSCYIVGRQNHNVLTNQPNRVYRLRESSSQPYPKLLLGLVIQEFAAELYDKALKAQAKYGFNELGWASPDWQEELQRGIAEHLQKGDPRDVAIYSLFAWFHGWPTAAPAPASSLLVGGPAEAQWAALEAKLLEMLQAVQPHDYWTRGKSVGISDALTLVRNMAAAPVSTSLGGGAAPSELEFEVLDAGYVHQAIRKAYEANRPTEVYNALVEIDNAFSVHNDKLRALLAQRPAPGDQLLVESSGGGQWIPAVEGKLPTEFDEDGLTQKWLVCIDGKPSWEGHYYTKSGRWMVAGRYGYTPNVTHYMDYPDAPTDGN